MSADLETDRRLWRGVQTGNSLAIDTFLERFLPIANRAALGAGIRGDYDRRQFAWDAVTDLVLTLRGTDTTPPANVAGYVVMTVKNRAFNERRAAARRQDRLAAIDNPIISEATLRAAASGPLDDWETFAYERPQPTRRVERNAARVMAELTREELAMMTWVGERVTNREIAERIGTTHNATRVRILRLRRRLQRAMPYVSV